ncbi:hypothetical protein HHK36_018672 [Tetracentron sinense]|uniref:Non-specific lipid-transfer protein n=1 Tax=Tetracentron sinense TaxID=13715 RepID=A0A834YWA5_TETSI|nr:hypothetical protein HHK36_018672 [Tetracentron sinense]
MASSGVLKFACIMVLACMLVAAPHVDASISCTQVSGYLVPCLNYLIRGGQLLPSCCKGVQNLNSAAKSTPDRQTACGCLKTASRNMQGLKLGLANSLPGKCGVRIPYQISPSTDCASSHFPAENFDELYGPWLRAESFHLLSWPILALLARIVDSGTKVGDASSPAMEIERSDTPDSTIILEVAPLLSIEPEDKNDEMSIDPRHSSTSNTLVLISMEVIESRLYHDLSGGRELRPLNESAIPIIDVGMSKALLRKVPDGKCSPDPAPKKPTLARISTSNHILFSLDFALANHSWWVAFPSAIVYNVSAIGSDHNPIVISSNMRGDRIRKLFRMSPILSMMPRLTRIYKSSTLNWISAIAQEETMWRQKSRAEWLLLGDRNTRFLHTSVVQGRQRNKVLSLKDEARTWITEGTDIKNLIVGHFQKLYSSSHPNGVQQMIEEVSCHITSEMNAELCRPVSEKEIKNVVFQIWPLKAPDPNEMSGVFYQYFFRMLSFI